MHFPRLMPVMVVVVGALVTEQWLARQSAVVPIVAGANAGASATPVPMIVPTATPVPRAAPTAQPESFNLSAVQTAMQGVVSAHTDLKIGVSVIRIKDGSRTDVNGSAVFTAASTAKAFIACLALHEVEQGALTLDTQVSGATAQWHLQQMINRSNNDSWMALMQYMGYSKQTPYAKSIGVTSYDYINNRLSPNDAALVLYKLYSRQLLTEEHTKLLLSYMQKTNMELLIPPAVPAGVTVYHKYGDYDGNLHDTAVIDDGKEPIVLVIYTSGSMAYEDRYEIFHQLVKAVETVPGI